jgi:hypothetical protein
LFFKKEKKKRTEVGDDVTTSIGDLDNINESCLAPLEIYIRIYHCGRFAYFFTPMGRVPKSHAWSIVELIQKFEWSIYGL